MANIIESLTNLGVRQLDESGQLGPVTDICINRAETTYLSRALQDTNPLIVKMIFRGGEIDHWYYRSNEWVDQPYFVPQLLLQPYVGPARSAMRLLYGPGTYIVDEESTEDARFLLENPELQTVLGTPESSSLV